MPAQVKTSTKANFKISLENRNNPNDTTTRTLSFDVPSSADPDDCAQAATLFSAASMSAVFQPTSWRDSEGTEDVYIFKGVTPVFVEETVTEYDTVIPE